MESVYTSFNANSSEKLNIKKHFEDYANLLNYKFNCHDGNEAPNTVNIPLPLEELEQLAEDCRIDLLNDEGIKAFHDNRRSIVPKDVKIPEGVKLQTLLDLKKKYEEYDSHLYNASLKYINEQIVNYPKPKTKGPKAKPGEDILIFIRVYKPFSAKSEDSRSRHTKIRLAHVIAMLGRQTLAELRDKIQCLSDLSVTKESSEHPNTIVEVTNKDIYKSGFFYIENTFYNDMRDPKNKDNSLPIREWAKTRNLGPFYIAKMEETRVDSLTVRFGYPWVYQHQGNCEHLIVISDARLVASDDDLAISNYPRIHRSKPVKVPSCNMCLERSAQWIVYDNPRIPHDPSYHCRKCFLRFNYLKGKKIGNFKAYRYPYDPKLMKLANVYGR
ncbi:snRNA-activating protein complex subunit 3 [Chelonus insularis]|uniref:snRNA-activating protein complex subunit 3 n=1 Tax=Chelonus insularis TaxID=460826 RepID=UPI001588F7D1|nr:snRNA-activating protein complex subunit 3 [Chelonus insularis]